MSPENRAEQVRSENCLQLKNNLEKDPEAVGYRLEASIHFLVWVSEINLRINGGTFGPKHPKLN